MIPPRPLLSGLVLLVAARSSGTAKPATGSGAPSRGALSNAEIRYISAADATTRFGTGHPLGAILVATTR